MKKKKVKLLNLNKNFISNLNSKELKGGNNTGNANCTNTGYSLGQLTCECPTESHRPDCISTYSPDTPAECGMWTTTNEEC